MQNVLNCAMDICEQMLICGAEVYRVEDSLCRICTAFGAQRVDAFIITSTMIVTVYSDEGRSYSQTRRIKATGTDIERLHKLNMLSRDICGGKLSAEQAKTEYDNIINLKKNSFLKELIAFVVIGSAFTLFFGGTAVQAIIAAVIAALLKVELWFAERFELNIAVSKLIASFIITLLAFFAVKFSLTASMDEIIIGNIMLLIPGAGFTNALRDLFIGDSVTGILRLVEAVLTALALAAGYFIAAFITGGFAL